MPSPERRAVGVAALVAALALAGACRGTTAPDRVEAVHAVAGRVDVQVTNQSSRTVFYFLAGRVALSHADWIPCVDATRCPTLRPGAVVRLPRPEPWQGMAEREAVLYWWTVTAPGDAPQVTGLRSLVVRL
jgi:hypothetical protein